MKQFFKEWKAGLVLQLLLFHPPKENERSIERPKKISMTVSSTYFFTSFEIYTSVEFKALHFLPQVSLSFESRLETYLNNIHVSLSTTYILHALTLHDQYLQASRLPWKKRNKTLRRERARELRLD